MSHQNHRPNTGFSLLEMTVVLAIVAIMTSIVLMNLPQMKGGMSIDVVAQEVAIYIRGAQVYSGATKAATDKQYGSYGLHFVSGPSAGRSFFLWADENGNVNPLPSLGLDPVYTYDGSELPNPSGGGGDGPAQEVYTLPNGFYISKLFCIDDHGSPAVRSVLDIVFKLPDPEANFGAVAGNGNNPCLDDGGLSKLVAGVCLTSPNLQQFRLIKTFNNGQIMVENPADTNIWSVNPCSLL